ncbi:MAG: CotH kinase family protein, partial [Bacteroidales bacterium]|nr:CotH kinase family protein [Bacteroidales bacterium]
MIDTKGVLILNEPKVPAEMNIYIRKAKVQTANIGIEYRGSTSFRLSDKKSFGIETWDIDGNDIDVAFFDFPKEEDWILSGHIVNLENSYMFDRTLMYNHFGYQLFQKMGRYASRSKFVELEINGDYQGVYAFMEKLKRDENRINIERLEAGDNDTESITGGYILKIDKTAGGDLNIDQPLEYFESNWEDDARYTSDISFRSQYDINGELIDFEPYGPPYHPDQYLETYFLYEYPKSGTISEPQKSYIRNYIHDFETSLLTDDFATETRTYTDYIDLGSFVDFFILNEVCRNVDAFRLSTFLVKERGGKLRMGPVWDLDIGYDNGDRVPIDDWVINYNGFVDRDPWMMPFWWPRLMEDPLFRTALKARWAGLRSG